MLNEQIAKQVATEVQSAYAKHGIAQWGRHEFYGILKEEVDELWDAIKSNKPMEEIQAEAIQIAAVIFRYLETGDRYKWVKAKPSNPPQP